MLLISWTDASLRLYGRVVGRTEEEAMSYGCGGESVRKWGLCRTAINVHMRWMSKDLQEMTVRCRTALGCNVAVL